MIAHQVQIKQFGLLAAVLVSTVLAFPYSMRGDTAPPQAVLKAFPLHNHPHSADISQDEKSVVIECTVQSGTGNVGTKGFGEVVQIWGIEQDKLVAEFRLPQTAVKSDSNGSFTDNIKLYKHVGYRVDREEVHPQFGATVYMSKHLLPV